MNFLKRVFDQSGTRDAALWWLGSRVAVLCIFLAVSVFLPRSVAPRPMHLYDAEFYIDIAEHGYQWNGDQTLKQNAGFFPLLPLVMKAFAAMGAPADWAGTVMNNALFLAALIVLSRLRGMGLSRTQQNIFCFLICFHPASFYFSIPYTETMFLLIAALIFFCVERGQFAQSAALAFLMGMVRSNGWIAGASVLVAALIQRRRAGEMWGSLVTAACGFAGTAVFLLFCQLYLGDWSATIKAQYAWGHKQLHFYQAFISSIGGILRTGEMTHWRVLLDAVWMVATFGVAVASLVQKRFTLQLRLFALLSALFPLLMLGGVEVRSTIRYAMVIFPTLAQLAIWCERRVWLRIMIAVLWISLFVFFTGRVLCAEWVQ
ncbi:MAG: mannosyltransferase family protein [Candidatus Sumerlaeota bacterium]